MDFLLKQRLIGAVVLVALGVIFIPMLLEGPRDPVMPEMQAMPEQQVIPREDESRTFPKTEKVLPLPPMSVLTAATKETADNTIKQPVPVPKPAAPDVVKTKPKPKVVKADPAPVPKAAPKPVAKKAPPANNKLGSWVVQVGSFSDQKNAFSLRDKLRKAGYPTQVERVALDKGVTYRVRVGPYLDRDKADAKIDLLNKKFQLQSRVLAYP